MRGKCERRGGNINADGAGAEVFVGDGCSQGASFGPIAAISRRWRGGRIYNNTRTRERLRRKCVKPADLTTHSPPKICSRPSRATRPSRTPPLPHAATMHARRPHDPFPTEDLRSPPHTSAPPRSPDAHPQAARCTPADLTTHSPPKACSRPRTTTRPPRALSHPLPAPTHTPTQPRCTPADLTTHSPPKNFALPAAPPCLPFCSASGTKKRHRTVDVRCRMSRSTVVAVGHWVGEPRAVRRRCGALAWRVGLRPQPWALRSRRCGRVLRA